MNEQTADFDFQQRLDEYKNMVVLRQSECSSTAQELDKEARRLSHRGNQFKIILIIGGVVVATKAAFELAMLNSNFPSYIMSSLSFLFLIIGLVIATISALQTAFRYDERAGRMRSLSNLCNSYNRRFMSDYKKDVDPENPEITLARLESLIDLQNESLDNIRQQSVDLGVDLSKVHTSYRVDDGELAT